MNLLYHLYFQRGRKFAHGVGQFPHWALLAPEEGAFTYALGTAKGSVSFGQFLVCPPHTVFHRHIEGALSYHIIAFESDEKAGGEIPTGLVTIRDTLRLSSTLHHLREFSGRDSAFVTAACSHLLNDLLYLASQERHQLPPAAGPSVTGDHTTVLAKQYIEERAFTSFSLRQVAEDVRLTPVQLTRRFRATFGQTPVQYLTTLRLAKARALLVESDLPLRQIAHQCGFNSEHYLSRVFQEATQMRPGKFREIRRF